MAATKKADEAARKAVADFRSPGDLMREVNTIRHQEEAARKAKGPSKRKPRS